MLLGLISEALNSFLASFLSAIYTHGNPTLLSRQMHYLLSSSAIKQLPQVSHRLTPPPPQWLLNIPCSPSAKR